VKSRENRGFRRGIGGAWLTFAAFLLASCSAFTPGLVSNEEVAQEEGPVAGPLEVSPETPAEPAAEAATDESSEETEIALAENSDTAISEESITNQTPEEETPLVALPSDDREFEVAAGISHKSLGTLNTDEFIHQLESDRRLLVEIRKEVPQNRPEAEIYLARLKELSTHSGPVRLVPLANRLLSQSSIYFDWLNTEFESQEDQVREYYIGGARGFHFAMEEFKSAVLFAVINRLDIAAKVVRELEEDLLRSLSEEME
jgi:hypothetical protein